MSVHLHPLTESKAPSTLPPSQKGLKEKSVEERIGDLVCIRFSTLVTDLTTTLTFILPTFLIFGICSIANHPVFGAVAVIGMSIFFVRSTISFDNLATANFLPSRKEEEKIQKEKATVLPLPKIETRQQKLKWFEVQDSKREEERYFISLYRAEYGSKDDMITHFQSYKLQDDCLVKGTYPITPGTPWEDFALLMQKKMQE